MKNRRIFRILPSLVLLTVLLLISSCGYRTIEPTEENLCVIGTVGDREILYEELYFVAMTYRDRMEETYGKGLWDDENSREAYRKELEESVYKNLTANSAVLNLAEEAGHRLEDKDVQNYTDEELKELVDSLGGFHAYRKFLNENYLSDHFLREQVAINILESNLLYDYTLYQGIIESDAEAIQSIILKSGEYICTAHLYLAKTTEERTEEVSKEMIENILYVVRNKNANFQGLVERYNEDKEQTMNGYYYMKGEMNAAYEEAAFALDIYEVSDIVETEDGYYLIMRLPLNEDYVKANCYGVGATLYDNYQRYKLLELIDAEQDSLTFVLNDYGKSIDLTLLEREHYVDVLFIVSAALGGTLLTVFGVSLILVFASKRKKKAGNSNRPKPNQP